MFVITAEFMTMRCHRVFVDSRIECEQLMQLPEPQSHYLGKVLRVLPGQLIQIFNGLGGCYSAEVVTVQKRKVSVIPRQFIPDETDTSVRINLAQAISRGKHMDYTIQKAVELGVSRIIPLITEFSNVHLSAERSENRLSHWRGIVVGACEQSGRNVIPELAAPLLFDEWLSNMPAVPALLLHPDAAGSLSAITPQPAELTIVSGPEGGFSEREVAKAKQQGCVAVKLGPRILRTETAAVAAISACQTLWGDMG